MENAPRHILDAGGSVSRLDNWYAHSHPHRHANDLHHTKNVAHEHEHCWEPQERHHHAVHAEEDYPPMIIYYCGPTPAKIFLTLQGVYQALSRSWRTKQWVYDHGKPEIWRGVIKWERIDNAGD